MADQHLIGTEWDDYLVGADGNDWLEGLAGDDILFGYDGNDLLDGGSGNDRLLGGAGDDVYISVLGGVDYVSDYAGFDELHLEGISPGDVERIRQDGSDDLILRVLATGDQITLAGWFYDPANAIERIVFDDGTVWSASETSALRYLGTTGNDFLQGTQYDETFEGRGGNDGFSGAGGNDVYVLGDLGFDSVSDWAGDDEVRLPAGIAPDQVERIRFDGSDNLLLRVAGTGEQLTLFNWFFDPSYQVERIVFDDGTVWDPSTTSALRYFGTEGDDFLQGTQWDERIEGRGGNDQLDGGLGADTLLGGTGHDTYFVDHFGDAVIEDLAEGIDTTYSSVSRVLGANLEHLVLLGSAQYGIGNALPNTITGNDFYNDLQGAEGADSLYGHGGDDLLNGGAGDDYLDGGDGNDTLDISGGGIDTVRGGESADRIVTGTALAASDRIDGDAGNDTLDIAMPSDLDGSALSLEASTLINVERIIISSGLSYTLRTHDATVAAGQSLTVERLWSVGGTFRFDGSAETDGNFNVTGGQGNDVLTGGAGADSLNGGAWGDDFLDGGAGADVMIGGRDDDTYVVDHPGDVVIDESFDTDHVLSSISYVLSSVIENLTLTGQDAIDGTGNGGANVLVGNAASNSLFGEARADILEGGGGNDLLHGGIDADVARFSGSSGGYAFSVIADRVQVIDIDPSNGDEGIDTLDGIESVRFSGGDVRLSTDVHLSTLPLAYRDAPKLVGLEGGGYLAVWQGAGDGDDRGIFAQRYGTDGAPVGPETRVNTTVADMQHGAAIATLSGGGYVVTWQSENQDGSRSGIYSQRFDAASTPVGIETQVNTYTALEQSGAGVTGLDDGGYVVSWQSNMQDGTGFSIYHRRYDANGTAAGSETRVNTTVFSDQLGSSVTATGQGGYVVTWTGPGLRMQRYDAAGNALGGETLVSSTGAGGTGARLADGGFVITWVQDSGPADSTDVYARRYSATGEPLGNEFRVNSTTPQHQMAPKVAALPDGGYVITWGSPNADGTSSEVFAQRYAADGAALGGELQVNTLTQGFQLQPTVASLSDGGYVVGWSSRNGNAFDVLARRFGADNAARIDQMEIVGTAGNDVLNAFEGEQTLDGGAGADTISGGAGDDHLIGGAGDDRLDGGSGQDTMAGGAGNDLYIVDDPSDWIIENPGEGVDSVESSAGNYQLADHVENLTLTASAASGTGNDGDNIIVGTDGDNGVYGRGGNDVLIGGGGNDYIADYGDAGNDRLIGGSGNDWLIGMGGDDVYEPGFPGADTVWDTGGDDEVRMGPGITPGQVERIREDFSNHLVLRIAGTTDQVTLSNWFLDPSHLIERVVFEDGTIWDPATAAALRYLGTAGDDYLTGSYHDELLEGREGNDVLDGREGADTLVGGAGADTYVFSLLDGAGNTALVGAGDRLYLPDLSRSSVLMTRDASNLYVSVPDIGASITLQSASGLPGEEGWRITLEFGDGSVWLPENVVNTSPYIGTNGDDVLYGSEFGDQIFAVGGNDVVHGNDGHDVLYGGAGQDTLHGGTGNDYYYVADGGDTIVENAGEGDDSVESSVSFSLAADVENLFLTGTAQSGTGNELGNTLVGNVADNVLSGGAGADSMHGGAGNDRYIVDDSGDRVFENANEGVDTVESAIGYVLASELENLTLTGTAATGSGNAVNNVLFGNAADNTLYAYEGDDTLLGMAGDDLLFGGAGGDEVFGGDDWDSLYGDAGDDLLDGGAGNDGMQGGAGNDTYLFARGSGYDAVWEFLGTAADTDIVVLSVDLAPSDITVEYTPSTQQFYNDGGFLLFVNGTNDLLKIVWSPATGPEIEVEEVRFADGTIWDEAALIARAVQNGDAPMLVNPIADQAAVEDAPFSYVVPADTFDDADIAIGDSLVYTATLADGSTLPSWLSFAGNAFGGTAANADVGTLSVRVTATDESGRTASDVFGITIANTNDAPTLANAIADQSAAEDSAFSFAVPSDSFVDPDAGDALAYSATLANGDSLPSWLSFDAGSRTFSGTPLNADVGTLSIRVTATDGSTAAVSDVFDLSVLNTNDAPTLANPIADQSAQDTVAFGFTVPVNTFADVDAGDLLTYSTGALPAWLSFNVATRTFSGTPGAANIGAVDVEVFASDAAGSQASDVFRIAVAAAPDRTVTGTSGNDTLVGASGNDTINGLGGADRMSGGLGNDTYFVDQTGDQVIEAAGAGIDTVNSSISYTLGANVENLTLTGTANRNATGNALDNVLAGNSGKNTLAGLAGNDTYIVTQTNDSVVESFGNGTDTVRASISYTLGNNVEKLVLTGSGNINGTGNSLANALTGNAGNNTLHGQGGADVLSGGAGNDILTGGSGTDEFYFGEAPGAGGVDRITDFSAGERLQFEEFVFTGIGAPGDFAPNDPRFYAAPGASGGADASDRVVYDTTDGNLYYDADGSGAGAATLIAILDNAFALSATDIGVL